MVRDAAEEAEEAEEAVASPVRFAELPYVFVQW